MTSWAHSSQERMSHTDVTTAGLNGCGASALQQQFRRLTKAVPQGAYKLYEALSYQWSIPASAGMSDINPRLTRESLSLAALILGLHPKITQLWRVPAGVPLE